MEKNQFAFSDRIWYDRFDRDGVGGEGVFNIGFAELIVVLLVAFLIVGPKDLPKVARWIARQLKAIRRMIEELKRETGWEELEKDIQDTQADVQATLKEADVTADIREAKQTLQRSWNDVKKDVKKMDEEAKKGSAK